MSVLIFKNRFVAYLVWILFLSTIAIVWLNSNRLEKERIALTKGQENVHMAYRSAGLTYELANKEAFDSIINTHAILELVYEGVTSEGKAQSMARGRLYRTLSPLYESLSEKNLRQLHFHLPDGKSYLRFHKPDRYGDDLMEARPSIKRANQERKMVSVFEAGRVVSGYRYVYPLTHRGMFLGTVETSISIKAILSMLSRIDASKEYAFLVNKRLSNALLFEEQKHLYTDASLHQDFVIEDANAQLPDSPKPLSPTAKAINAMLAHNPLLQAAMRKGDSFATFVTLGDETYSVTLEPIQGLRKEVEGYLIAYHKDATPQQLWRDFMLVVGLYGVASLFILILLWIAYQRAQHNLKQKEELRIITDTLAEGVYVIDERGIIQEVNSTACEILGYTKSELLGKEAHGLFHTHARNDFLPKEQCPVFEALMEKRAYYNEEEFFTCNDGTIIPVILKARPLIREAEKTLLVIAFYNNAEAYQHHATMRLLQQALEASSNAVVITNKEAVIKWANHAFEILTGFCVGEALGRKPKELISSRLQEDAFYAQMWQTILLGNAWHGELINKRKDGTLYHEELSITPVVGKSGEIEHFIAIKQDVSLRKQAYEELKSAKIEAEVAVQAKAQFLANMSHEIRTPLNAIIGFGDLMKETPLNVQQTLILSKLINASEILLRILNDILDYSKIEAGKLVLEVKEISLRQELQEIESLFSQTAAQKGLRLHVNVEDAVPAMVEADGLRLMQIVLNLVSNALKFTHEGSVTVTVSLVKQEETRAHLCFSVHDTGIGISHTKLQELFEPFTQADASTSRKYGGSGLGLSIVYKLVEAMGSHIEVQSSEGEGSTFFFELALPIVKAKPDFGGLIGVATFDVPDLKGQHILVVEDVAINQEVIKAIIERTGAHVELANNGKEAVEIFVTSSTRFTCILMDIQMPIMTGYEATANIRAHDSAIPIIALTAATTIEDRTKALEAGMNEHLSKPIHPQSLYALLLKYSSPTPSLKQASTPSSKADALPTLLIVDDNAANIRTLSHILKADYRIKVATDGANALKLAKELKEIDLILLDVMMPIMDGYAVCKALKENSLTHKIPVIFVTAKDSPEDEAYGFSLGAADYITKPFNPATAKVRIRHQIELKMQNDALEKLSMNDSLTKLRNRGYFDDYYTTTYKEIEREGGVLCVMMIDIDYFKAYNDHYGHGEGDVCLAHVAAALQQTLQRPSDTIARYGGEEFVVVLKNIGYEGALKVAEALRASVEALAIPHAYSNVAPYVSISVGVAFKKLDTTLFAKELLKWADEALYEAKARGRNCVVGHEI